jgi:drug/metabolite transporter (DMT)-like permease
MLAALVMWFALSVACDVAGQLCFKVGAQSTGEGPAHEVSLGGLLIGPWQLAGVAVYTIEIFVWLRILAEVPLSIAFPIASLNFLAITFASWLFLGEAVGRRQWLGVCLITFGVIVVAQSA